MPRTIPLRAVSTWPGSAPWATTPADDLPFYYWAATTFATSDRWFSPVLTRTQPNRMYMLAATSNGYAYGSGAGLGIPNLNMSGVKSIFQLLQENNITWKVYVTDNYVAGDLSAHGYL